MPPVLGVDVSLHGGDVGNASLTSRCDRLCFDSFISCLLSSLSSKRSTLVVVLASPAPASCPSVCVAVHAGYCAEMCSDVFQHATGVCVLW